jgi:succinyl-CoA synthetase beta subunit
MALLESFEIPTAPYVIGAADSAKLRQSSNFVVKLADVPHRTEMGAVAVGVSRDEVSGATERMRHLAQINDLPTQVVIQPMLEVGHELFIGIQGSSTFGPMLLFGIGGIAIEALSDVAMRIAPISEEDARSMLGDLRAARLLDDFRGRPGVDREALVKILVNAGRLAAATSNWLESLDINPLISNRNGLAAVDVAVIVSPSISNKES